MDRLPFEMQQLILKRFSHRDLSTNIANVSTEWRRAAYDPSLWKSVILYGKNDWNWVLYLPKSIRDCVRSVDIKYFRNKFKGISLLVENFVYVEEIKTRLSIDCDYKWLKRTFEHIVRWDLKSISIRHPFHRFGRISALIADKCKNIESVVFPGIDKESLLIFTECLGAKLKRFHVSLYRMEADDYRFLSTCVNLTDLHWSYYCDSNIDSILLIQNFKSLQRLHVRGYSDYDMMDLLEKLFREAKFPHLLEFYLRIPVNDKVVDCLTKSCPSLRSLAIICDHEFTDCGVNAIIKRLHNLEYLRLKKSIGIRGNSHDVIPGESVISAECFVKIPKCLPFLTELHVDSSFEIKRMWRVLELLKQHKPNLKITRF